MGSSKEHMGHTRGLRTLQRVEGGKCRGTNERGWKGVASMIGEEAGKAWTPEVDWRIYFHRLHF